MGEALEHGADDEDSAESEEDESGDGAVTTLPGAEPAGPAEAVQRYSC